MTTSLIDDFVENVPREPTVDCVVDVDDGALEYAGVISVDDPTQDLSSILEPDDLATGVMVRYMQDVSHPMAPDPLSEVPNDLGLPLFDGTWSDISLNDFLRSPTPIPPVSRMYHQRILEFADTSFAKP